MNIQDWSPLGWTGCTSLLSKELSRVFSNTVRLLWESRDFSKESSLTNSSKASVFHHSAFIKIQLSHPYMTTGKTIALTIRTFVSNVMSLLFNMLSRFVIAFLPWSKRLLILWLQSPSVVILADPNACLNSNLTLPYLLWDAGAGTLPTRGS